MLGLAVGVVLEFDQLEGLAGGELALRSGLVAGFAHTFLFLLIRYLQRT